MGGRIVTNEPLPVKHPNWALSWGESAQGHLPLSWDVVGTVQRCWAFGFIGFFVGGGGWGVFFWLGVRNRTELELADSSRSDESEQEIQAALLTQGTSHIPAGSLPPCQELLSLWEHQLILLEKLLTVTALLKLTWSCIAALFCALSAGVAKNSLGHTVGLRYSDAEQILLYLNLAKTSPSFAGSFYEGTKAVSAPYQEKK